MKSDVLVNIRYRIAMDRYQWDRQIYHRRILRMHCFSSLHAKNFGYQQCFRVTRAPDCHGEGTMVVEKSIDIGP